MLVGQRGEVDLERGAGLRELAEVERCHPAVVEVCEIARFERGAAVEVLERRCVLALLAIRESEQELGLGRARAAGVQIALELGPRRVVLARLDRVVGGIQRRVELLVGRRPAAGGREQQQREERDADHGGRSYLARNLSHARRFLPLMPTDDSLEPWRASADDPWDRGDEPRVIDLAWTSEAQ